MTAEEIAKTVNDGLAEIKKDLSNAVKKEDFDSAKEKLDGLVKSLEGVDLSKMSKEIQDLSESLNMLKETGMKGKMSDLEKYQLKSMVKEKHEEIVSAVKEKRAFEFSFKVAAMHMTNNGTVTNADGLDYPATDNFLVDNDIAKIRYPENFLLNVIPNTQTSNVPAQRIRKEQAPKEGSVTVVAEGAVKPLLQYKFVRTSTDRVKYAGRIEWTEEFEMDFEALFREIVRLFEEDVIREWQDGLLDQIIADATAYVSSTLDGTLVAPDNGLAVVATQSQLQSLNYNPDVVIMNPADMVSTLFQQDNDGNLKLSPYINTTTGTINGMRLIQTNKVPVGTALIGESRLYREIHSDFIMRTGQYNAQLIENEYTAIGEVFSILSIAERDLVGWVAIDLDAVKTALQQVAP